MVLPRKAIFWKRGMYGLSLGLDNHCGFVISADQSHQLAADRDSNPPLAATSWSAAPPRTSAPVHSLWRAQRHGTSCRRIYGH